MPDIVLAFFVLRLLKGNDLFFRSLFLLVITTLIACSEVKTEHTIRGSIMGTTYSVKVIDTAGKVSQEVLEKGVLEVLVAVDSDLSTYKANSELMRFNRTKVGSEQVIGVHMQAVTRLALTIYRASEGYFDPSIGPLISAWGFGSEARELIPSDAEITRMLDQAGMRLLRLDEGARLVKSSEGFLDYSAIAKGYGVDQVAAYLEGLGLSDYMVEVGGEVRVSGVNKLGVKWRLGIEQPDLLERKAYNVVHIGRGSMATSGDYRNFIDSTSGRYSHTINPRTGRPVKRDIASVSVIFDACADADAWATALMAMGSQKAIAFAKEKGIPAYFILRKGDGFSSVATKEMQAYLQ